jgi:hypothetical protein
MQSLVNGKRHYDLILNADSMTEMDLDTAKLYWKQIKSSTSTFLSINHEANALRVQDLIAADLASIDVNRCPYWMRRGYVEEVIKIRSKTGEDMFAAVPSTGSG